jgi:hypothetical protein
MRTEASKRYCVRLGVSVGCIPCKHIPYVLAAKRIRVCALARRANPS